MTSHLKFRLFNLRGRKIISQNRDLSIPIIDCHAFVKVLSNHKPGHIVRSK